MKPTYKKIGSIKDLKTFFKKKNNNESYEFFIQLNLGRSWKTMSYDKITKKFWIENQIDGSEQFLTEKELFDKSKTLIGKAINEGQFYTML